MDDYLRELQKGGTDESSISYASAPSDRDLLITRVFDAPRSLVYKIWTQPLHMKKLVGTARLHNALLRGRIPPGGAWRVASRHSGGAETAEQGVFREIVELERLVFTHAWEDQVGRPGHETLVTVTFVEHDGKTKSTFHQRALPPTKAAKWLMVHMLERELRDVGRRLPRETPNWSPRLQAQGRHGANGIGLAVIALPCLLYSMDLTVLELGSALIQRRPEPAELAAALDRRRLRIPDRQEASSRWARWVTTSAAASCS